jgi:DNA polymerase-3 subunit gamma/tau
LEVGDGAKKSYLDQSKKTSQPFLLQAIDLANDCDLKYKASKNQRLLVELTLMKLASIDFDGEKKNPDSLGKESILVPTAFFRERKSNGDPDPHLGKSPSGKPEPSIPPQKELPSELLDTGNDNYATSPVIGEKTDNNNEKGEPKINIDLPKKRISGLSLSSLRAKKEHQLSKKEEILDEGKLPKTSFTEEEMQKHWNDFVAKIDAEGKKILASNLHTDVPKLLNDHTIWIELPNNTMKKEVERDQYDLMLYLKEQLNNHFITLKITVNEGAAKKYAFTPQEKYEKLREKNPIIDKLRQEFDLDF